MVVTPGVIPSQQGARQGMPRSQRVCHSSEAGVVAVGAALGLFGTVGIIVGLAVIEPVVVPAVATEAGLSLAVSVHAVK
ncbi:MAG TPA: hypothetical protein VH186_14640 [Chloroflexia bacterium]|nr:hypothetical protein [Chloroflexia bacterium]